jgi:predicted O-methyltransferase YrrM
VENREGKMSVAYDYDFSEDWFSHNIPQFERFLGHLKGKPCRLLEIGTYEGRSALWLAENIATHTMSSIETIDAYEQPRVRNNIADHKRITFRVGRSIKVMRTMPIGFYDFAYVDGCHSTTNVLEDAVLAFALLKVGGVLAFDDYLWDDPRANAEGTPRPAIDAFLSVYARKFELLHKDYQVWLRKTAH